MKGAAAETDVKQINEVPDCISNLTLKRLFELEPVTAWVEENIQPFDITLYWENAISSSKATVKGLVKNIDDPTRPSPLLQVIQYEYPVGLVKQAVLFANVSPTLKTIPACSC